MKRRAFLQLLGVGVALPAIAKEPEYKDRSLHREPQKLGLGEKDVLAGADIYTGDFVVLTDDGVAFPYSDSHNTGINGIALSKGRAGGLVHIMQYVI